jgi:hypothetical protein
MHREPQRRACAVDGVRSEDSESSLTMDESLIKRWAASPSVTEQIAADFAKKIDNGQLNRWAELARQR